MYTIKQKTVFTKPIKDGSIQTCYSMHITVDTIAEIPDAKENWLAGSRCDVLEDGGHVYMLSNSREWVEVNFFDRVGGSDGTDLSNFYTKSQTDERITEKIAEIVANAPEDFDTLKELSDWLYSHEDSAADMNAQIQQNSNDISQKVDKVPGMGLSANDFTNADKNKLDGLENYDDSTIKDDIAKMMDQITVNRDTLGCQKNKNLLKPNFVTYQYSTNNGIKFTRNADRSVTVTGTATADATLYFSSITELEVGKRYILTGCPPGGGRSTYELYGLDIKDWVGAGQDFGNGSEFIPWRDALYTYRIVIHNGTTVDNLIFRPMVRDAKIVDDTYEPYVDDLQTQIQRLMDRVAALENKI